MGGAVKLRQDFGADELRRFAAKAKDVAQARRLLALAAVHDGMNRSEAARIGGMDRQTLRDWVHRFNEYGPGTDRHQAARAALEALRGAEGSAKATRRDRSRPGDGWSCALALRRSEACSGAALR